MTQAITIQDTEIWTTLELQAIADNQAGRTCTVCRGTDLIRCPAHRLIDGWCDLCETGMTRPQPISCPCQNLPALD